MKILALACSLLLLATPSSFAANAERANSPAAKYIETLGTKALAIIQDNALNKEKKQETLSALFQENVDFDWVGKFVMGRFWRQATDDQKSRYITNYRKFLTKNYTSRFTEYTSGGFKVTDAKDIGKGEYVVSMEIQSDKKSEAAVLVDYKVRRAGGSFRVFDIIVEGVSMITTQRAEFGSVLNQKGIDSLIEQLAVK